MGIVDDVTHASIPFDDEFDIEQDDEVRAVFWGLGSDGTVSANKNTIKIIGEQTNNYTQGYFVYDSKKSGAVTISHYIYTESRYRNLQQSDPGSAEHLLRLAEEQLTERLQYLRSLADPGTT